MGTTRANTDIDEYAAGLRRWGDEFAELRPQLLAIEELSEELKWRKPCYVAGDSNIVIFQPFKDLCALLFFQGALLDDPAGLLQEQGPNSRSSLRMEFRSVDDVRAVTAHLPAYVRQAIDHARAGLRVPKRATSDLDMPEELLAAFDEDPRFREAFEALTPGRQRGYVLHFGGAKRPETRAARIERLAPRIFDGLGMHD